MPTEATLHLRNGLATTVTFADDEDWQFKDTEHVVLLLDGDRRPVAVANLADFVHLTVARGEAPDGDE